MSCRPVAVKVILQRCLYSQAFGIICQQTEVAFLLSQIGTYNFCADIQTYLIPVPYRIAYVPL